MEQATYNNGGPELGAQSTNKGKNNNNEQQQQTGRTTRQQQRTTKCVTISSTTIQINNKSQRKAMGMNNGGNK